MDKIAVLIPCYNEAKTISKVIMDFQAVLPEAVVYVYDNNSSDGTDKIAKDAGAVVRYEYQQGKGNVIRRMFAEVDARCYVMVDGDDTYPAENARKMAECILSRNADMVVGDRLSSTYFEENNRLFHNFGNDLVRKVIHFLFQNEIKDIMTGYRAFSYRFVKTFPVLSQGFEIETEMSIHAIDKNMQIENIVCNYRNRPEGSESKLNTYADGIKVLLTILKLFRTYRPMKFFSMIAICLAAVSTAFLVPVFHEYFKTGFVPNFPTLIVCGFIMLAALYALFSGIVLQTIYQKNRQDFEIDLYRVSKELSCEERGVIADIGCGREAAFLNYYSASILKGYGFDFRIGDQDIGNLTLINNKGSDGLDIESCCCDTVFMLAVLEHLDTPKVLLKEIHRILKPGGSFCLTTPTPAAKPVLECMAALHIINREEILEHKHYYTGQEIHTLMEDCGFACDRYKKFCFGMNSMAVGIKVRRI